MEAKHQTGEGSFPKGNSYQRICHDLRNVVATDLMVGKPGKSSLVSILGYF